MENEEQWKLFLNKKVKLIIEDTNFPKKKEGTLISLDNTHFFIKHDNGEIIAYLKTSVKRLERLENV